MNTEIDTDRAAALATLSPEERASLEESALSPEEEAALKSIAADGDDDDDDDDDKKDDGEDGDSTVATAKAMVTHNPPTGDSVRWYYMIDKARSLTMLCELIKCRKVLFPRYDSWKLLADDFVALIEDRRELVRGSDIYIVTKKASKSDDYAHAVNLAALSYWHTTKRYPNLATTMNFRITSEQEAIARGQAD